MRSLIYTIYKGSVPILSTFSWSEAEASKAFGCTYTTSLITRKEKEPEISKIWREKRMKALA